MWPQGGWAARVVAASTRTKTENLVPDVMQDIDEIKTLAREFARTELRPHVEQWDHDRAADPGVFDQIADLGFFGMVVPEPFGGMGFDRTTYVTVLEQLAWGEAGVAIAVAQNAHAANLIDQFGSAAQKSQWLESIASGKTHVSFALAEAEAGSDLSSIETNAQADADGWIVSGRKAWVTNPGKAHLAIVLARANGEPRLFLIPRSSSWQTGEREHTTGLNTLEIADVNIDNARVNKEAALDADASPAPAAPSGDLGRLSIAAISVGVAQAALEHAIAYANEREQFATKLRNFEGLQYKLADMATRVEAARALTLHAAAGSASILAAMAKLFASEVAMWVTTQAVQIFGGYGYMRDYPVEKLMRDAKAMALIEGANELQRVFIAKALYDGE
jgi:alkylation response protein AidB-like acyl-CoA dehydrogenase